MTYFGPEGTCTQISLKDHLSITGLLCYICVLRVSVLRVSVSVCVCLLE